MSNRITNWIEHHIQLLRWAIKTIIGVCPQDGCWNDCGGNHVGMCSRCWNGRPDQGEVPRVGELKEQPLVVASVPTAAELLERAHIMLDGWQQAVDWHRDYEKLKAQSTQP